MKELPIEEKAKAYDEAIDKVAHFIKKHIGLGCIIHPNSSEAKELFNIFPELKESEDERIRKWLVEELYKSVNSSISKGFDIDMGGKALAWLEKQGEQNSDKIVEKAKTEKQRVLLTETDGTANIDWDTRSLQDVKLLLEYGLDYIKKLEKQGDNMGISEATKQKLEDNLNKALEKETPESWSEFLDEQNLANSTKTCKPYGQRQECFDCQFNYAGECKGLCVMKRNEQKPTDEEMKELLRTEYEKGRADAIAEMQKPWSEEDEEMVEHISKDLDELEEKSSWKYIDEQVNWLKSLKDRYTWKPSDEQIEALETTLYTNMSRNDERYSVLSKFVTELKKLKSKL